MDRRGHAMPGMDRVYTHVTIEMRERLSAVLEDLWQNAIRQRRTLSPRSNVPLLDHALNERECHPDNDLATRSATRRPQRAPSREATPLPCLADPLYESNPKPSPYHGDALPTELRGAGQALALPDPTR